MASNQINRDTADAAYRAFVVNDSIGISFSFDAERQKNMWKITPWWENTGNSPTRDLKIFFNWCPRVAALPDNFSYPDLSIGGSRFDSLGPHQHIPGLSYKIDPEAFTLVKNHQATFYFYGWATYKDILDPSKIHKTYFCRYIDGFEGDPFDAKGAVDISYCDHNCTDEECDRYPQPRETDSKLCGVTAILVSKPSFSVPAPTSPLKQYQ